MPKLDIVEHLMGPHEWGYRDPVVGGFIADEAPFEAAVEISRLRAAIASLRPTVEKTEAELDAFMEANPDLQERMD